MSEVTLPRSHTGIDTDDWPGWELDALDEYFCAAQDVNLEAPKSSDIEIAAYIYAAARGMNLSPKSAQIVCKELGYGEDAGKDFWARVADASKQPDRDPWNWLREHVDDPDHVQRLKIALRDFPTDDPEPEPTAIDLSNPAREPNWIIRGQIAAKRCTMASADQSASKTTWAVAVMRAVIRGEQVLGREAKRGRVLYLTNEEDAEQFADEKLKPLGFSNDDREGMEIYTRGTFPLLGTDAGNAWIMATVEAGDFDLIVLDTTSSIVSTDSNNPDAVNALFTDIFDPLLDRTGAALLYLHHERKSGGSGDRSQAARGARAWSDRANFHVTFATVSKYTETPTGNGEHVATARKFVQRRAKVRGGGVDDPLRYELRGEKNRPDGATLALALELPKVEYTDAEQIAAACDGETTRKALAEATGWNATGDRFTNALDAALDEKLIRRIERGVYAPGEATE